MRSVLLVAFTAAAGFGAVAWSAHAFGADSVAFAFLVVWVPMTALGTVSHFVTIRLPAAWHRLRSWEAPPRVYELLGVRVAKQLLRRGPLAVFNPHLHLPAAPSPSGIDALERRMCEAEASHMVLLVLTLGVAPNAAAHGWWAAAAWTVVFDLLMNAYPVMLQRYNRVMLRHRFPTGGPVRGG